MIGASFEDALLTIRVIDNGCGMDEELLASLNEKMKQPGDMESRHSSIGFFNVNSRIKLRYGPESGLILANNPAGGLCVTIAIRYQ
jgi:two-component system sensor histidine kinase YesM